MNNEAVSRAESVPDQVGDVLRAKHAGSRVVLPTARAALCHLLKLVCVHTEGFGLSANRGKPKPFVMSDKHWEWRGSMPGCKTDWKALGGIRRRRWGGGTEGHERVWAVNSPSVLLSPLFFYSPFLSSSNLVGKKKNECLHQPIRQWGFEVARGSKSLLVISPLLSTRALLPFQASVSLFRQGYKQSHDRCWDFKALLNGQDNTIKQTEHDDRGGIWEREQREICQKKYSFSK